MREPTNLNVLDFVNNYFLQHVNSRRMTIKNVWQSENIPYLYPQEDTLKHWASQWWVSVINLAYLWQKIFSECPNIYRTDFVFLINKNVTVNIESNCYITQCTHPRCKFFWNIFLQYSLEESTVTTRKIFVIKKQRGSF